MTPSRWFLPHGDRVSFALPLPPRTNPGPEGFMSNVRGRQHLISFGIAFMSILRTHP